MELAWTSGFLRGVAVACGSARAMRSSGFSGFPVAA